MKVTIYLRRSKSDPTKFTMRTDFTSESLDTPRIHNFGMDIKEVIDGNIDKCVADGVVRYGKVGE